MSQTALNLIAIAVFAMTLSSLLGPVFNINPAIPAITTFGILSLATLDAFRWQSQGANLLLSLFATDKERDRILHHEAGHFFAAYLLNIPITDYTLSAWEAIRQGKSGQGGVTFAPIEITPQLLPVTIERYCTVWMAGIAAEILVYGTAEGGNDDRQQLRNSLAQLGKTASSALQQENWSLLQAKNLIQQNWAAYEALVAAMQQRASVEECCQILPQYL
jgi:hypothetical protein